MMMKNLFLILSLFTSISMAQDLGKIVATVGGKDISVDEYQLRFEFMPHLNYSDRNQDTIKKEFLYSLVAEKLWSLEASDKKFDTLDIFNSSIKTLEKLFIKDELFRKEVESKLNLSTDEILFGIKNFNRIVYVNFLLENDSSKIFSKYERLKNGVKFDFLYNIQEIKLRQIQPLKIKIGYLEDEYVEKIIFNLQMNEYTMPINSGSQWYVFKYRNEEIDTTIQINSDMTKNKVIYLLKERLRRKISENFIDNLIGGQSITANKKLVNLFANQLIEILKTRKMTREDSLYGIVVSEFDLMKTLKLISDAELNSTLFILSDTKISLKDFIFYLFYQKLNFISIEEKSVQTQLSAQLKNYIESEILVREGYRQRLNELQSFNSDLNIWRDYYLAELILQSYRDSINVNDFEIDEYSSLRIKNSLSIPQVNILEILTTDLIEMEEVLEKLKENKEFKELAKKYNHRESTKKSDGEWGYFLSNYGGKIGQIASSMNIGEIYGPIKLDEGYSIFKLIGKKVIPDSVLKSDSLDKKFIREKIFLTKLNDKINSKTRKLAKKYGVKINEKILRETILNQTNTFTYRLIGFGGKIAALPITIPIFAWYKTDDEYINIP